MDNNDHRDGRESLCASSEAHDLVEMNESSVEVRRFPVEGALAEDSLNSINRTWERLSQTATPPNTGTNSSGMQMGSADETRPLLTRHARQIEERRQGER